MIYTTKLIHLWHMTKELFEYANKLGSICFSSVFDDTSIDFLEKINNPIYKISSFENTDLELIKNTSMKKTSNLINGLASLSKSIQLLKFKKNTSKICL